MSVDGKWNVTLNSPMGAQQMELNIKAAGAAVTGTMSAQGNTLEIANGKLEGDALTWSASLTQPMPITLEFSAKVAGSDISGSAKAGAFGSFPFTGKKA